MWSSPPGKWLWGVSLLLLVGLAAGLRLWGLGWGFPLRFGHIDESVVVHYTLRIVAGDPNPRPFFDYPGLYLYLAAASQWVVWGVGRLVGFFPDMGTLLEDYARGLTVFPLAVSRALTLLFSLATVGVVMNRNVRDSGRGAGLFAGLTLAVLPLHVKHSHYGTVDVAAAFFFLVALGSLIDAWEHPQDTRLVEAGFLVGLATAVKYYPGLLVLWLWPRPWLDKQGNPWGRWARVLVATVAGFVVGSPFSLLDPLSFASRFKHIYSAVVGGGGASIPWGQTLMEMIRQWGWAGVPLVGAALLWGVLRPRSTERRLAIVFLVYLLFLSFWRVQSPHYGLFLYPVLCLLMGRFFAELSRLYGGLVWSLGGAVLLVLSLASLEQGVRIALPDTRLVALDYLRHHLTPGARVFRFAHTPEFTVRDPYRVTVDWENHSLLNSPAPAFQEAQVVVYSSYSPGSDEALASLSSRLTLRHRVDGPSPEFPHHPAVFIFQGLAKDADLGWSPPP